MYVHWCAKATNKLIPESLKEDILKLYHDVPTAGHLGIDKYLKKIKQDLHWSSMKDDVTKYCNSS
jgi:hypothetical protein